MKKLLIVSIVILISITFTFYFYNSEKKLRKAEEDYIYTLVGDSLRVISLELHDTGRSLLDGSYDKTLTSSKFIYTAREAGKISGYLKHLNYIGNGKKFGYDEIRTWENFHTILLSLSNNLDTGTMSEQEIREIGRECLIISEILGYKKFRPSPGHERTSTKFGREILSELNYTELNEHLNHIYEIAGSAQK
jgi:hypothetical protein